MCGTHANLRKGLERSMSTSKNVEAVNVHATKKARAGEMPPWDTEWAAQEGHRSPAVSRTQLSRVPRESVGLGRARDRLVRGRYGRGPGRLPGGPQMLYASWSGRGPADSSGCGVRSTFVNTDTDRCPRKQPTRGAWHRTLRRRAGAGAPARVGARVCADLSGQGGRMSTLTA